MAEPRTDAPSEFEAALEGSRLYRGLSWAGTWLANTIRGSFIYRWLTAEPDPDVIVIDLRETWTVGPFITILDWIFGRLEEAAEDSTIVEWLQRGAQRTLAEPLRVAGTLLAVLAFLLIPLALVSDGSSLILALLAAGCFVAGILGVRDDRSWAELKETRVVELLIAAFEPPEPPDEHRENRESDDDSK